MRSPLPAAPRRGKKLCSGDKAKLLETMDLRRDVMTEAGAEYPDMELSYFFVDAAAMELIRRPTHFDVIATGSLRMLRYSFDLEEEVPRIEAGVRRVPADGLRTGDIMEPGATRIRTREMGEAVAQAVALAA